MKCIAWMVIGVLAYAGLARADDPFDEPPISYSTSKPHDPVEQLIQRIKSGQTKLTYTPAHGYLESLLQALKIPASSQTLVFSKTSFQRERISPEDPRALYFNDDTYVGYVSGGADLEIATTDPAIGTVFYTIAQHPPAGAADPIPPVREINKCMECHGGGMTHDNPGLIMRSTYPDSNGQPILSAGTFLTTQQSPLSQRWGGWLVTGVTSQAQGMGNILFQEQSDESAKPASIAKLQDASAYLSARSDAVTLMVLAHQTEAHNRFTEAVYATRRALRDEKILADALGEKVKPGEHSDSTMSRIKSGCEPLVQYLLFCDEAPFPAGISADSPFVRDFTARGPKDSKGRSLRDFDLKTRLFRYPCSYLIYSTSFDGLPEPARNFVYRRLWEVLTGKETGKEYAHLTQADRKAILEIIRQTKEKLPSYWMKDS